MQSLFFILVVLFSVPVASGANLVSLVKDGEYTYISPAIGDAALVRVVAAFEKAHYKHQDPMVHLPETKNKSGTWCKVTADREHRIIGECAAILHPKKCTPLIGYIYGGEQYAQVPEEVEWLRQGYHMCQKSPVHL